MKFLKTFLKLFSKIKKIYKHGITVLFFTIIITALFVLDRVITRNTFKKNLIMNQQNTIDVVMQQFQGYTRVTKDVILSTVGIDKLLYNGLTTSDTAKQDRYRKRLYRRLEPYYIHLSNAGIRQIHFHDSTNHSYLRMHRPEKLGDDLTGFRATVAAVNHTHQPVKGFEEGRIFCGYRFVYPINLNGRYLGSFEISASPYLLGTYVANLSGTGFQILLKKSIVSKKVFTDEQSNYAQCRFLNDYVVDKETMMIQEKYIDAIIAVSEKLSEITDSESAGVIPFRHEDNDLLLSMIPIENFLGKQVGYILLVQQDKQLRPLLHDSAVQIVIIWLIALIIFLAILRYDQFIQKVESAENLVRICSYCHKITDFDTKAENPKWYRVEDWINRKNKTTFSHGMCPECFEREMKRVNAVFNKQKTSKS